MRSRRIVAGACALGLLVPAAASAQPIHDPPAPPSSHAPSYADQVSALPPEQLAAAYGTTKTDAKPVASPRAAIVTDDGGTNGWRIAAVVEAAVLAACALAAAVLLTGRRRAPRMGH